MRMGGSSNGIEFLCFRSVAALLVLSFTEGTAFPAGGNIASSLPRRFCLSVNERPALAHQASKREIASLKLSLRGGGQDPNPTDDVVRCATGHRDLLPDVTCALKDKVPGRSGDLEEEDADGPHSDKGDVSEVTLRKRSGPPHASRAAARATMLPRALRRSWRYPAAPTRARPSSTKSSPCSATSPPRRCRHAAPIVRRARARSACPPPRLAHHIRCIRP